MTNHYTPVIFRMCKDTVDAIGDTAAQFNPPDAITILLMMVVVGWIGYIVSGARRDLKHLESLVDEVDRALAGDTDLTEGDKDNSGAPVDVPPVHELRPPVVKLTDVLK